MIVWHHYSDVTISAMASQIIGIWTVCLVVNWGAHQRKHKSSASLAFVKRIHRSPVDSPHKGQVTWQMFPFDDVIMMSYRELCYRWLKCQSFTYTIPMNTLKLRCILFSPISSRFPHWQQCKRPERQWCDLNNMEEKRFTLIHKYDATTTKSKPYVYFMGYSDGVMGTGLNYKCKVASD